MERRFYLEEVTKDGLVDYLLTIKHDARVTTLNCIKDIEQDELDWQPYEGWNSIGALLAHIIAVEQVFNIEFIDGRKMNEQEEKFLIPGLELGKYLPQLKGKTIEEYVALLQKGYSETRELIKNLTTEKLLKRRFDAYDAVTGSDMAWTLYHAAEDEVHHRGQISILRKLYKMRNV